MRAQMGYSVGTILIATALAKLPAPFTTALGLKMPVSLYLQVVANNRPSASGNPGTVTGAQHRNGAQYQPYLERFPLLQAKLRQESIT